MTAYPKPTRRIVLFGAALLRLNILVDRREQQRCARCGRIIWAGGSRHHRKFRSRRGSDSAANIVLMCGSGTTGCHGWVHANPTSAAMVGFALESWQDPTEHPIEHVLYGRVWLDDDGGHSGTPPRRQVGRAA
ncbi:hypothetical protein QN345_00615 [Cryobacterium sp. 10I1]|uniref:HNH endonuclease n=1 Tax=Cryobacterium sp. 10I1 TaxID=3048578 RepID=UPI002B226FEF|nr:hypothetical protein [Cryobacterium sp. 10I1]MEB0303842.1 hypothetical protein [Cryobacterium sp. 10I1]